MRLENVVLFTLSADNSYTELGPAVRAGHVEMPRGLGLHEGHPDKPQGNCAENPVKALDTFDRSWYKMLDRLREKSRKSS